MSSPIPPDPYQALGVAKDSDLTAIRTAHRKLALKHHPDRIKDESLREKGKDEFQKIQQAYEILSDPVRRSRYDDKVKLAELRRETMMREPPVRSTTYPMRPAPAQSSRPEYDGAYFETRAPAGAASYFDSQERFEEPISRASARKYDDYDRKPAARPAEKARKPSSTSNWSKPVSGFSFEAAAHLKKKAEQAKDRVRDKAREREDQAAKAKAKDRDERRDRSEKQSRRAFVVDDNDGSSDDSDAPTYISITPRASKPSSRPTSSRKPEPRRRSPERSRSKREDDEESYDDKWEKRHQDVREYIQKSSPRPSVQRADSNAHTYWEGEDRMHEKRSGSDSDRRPTSSKGRRPDMDIPKTRSTPLMPSHTSAPSGLRPLVEEREPLQARSSSSQTLPRERDREHRREMPGFGRAQTMPSSRSSRKDTAPSKGSNLKHAETQDSGYGSSSPHTPEMPGISPTRESSRPESGRQASTKYQIVEPDEESRSHRTILVDDEDKHRRYSSPPRERDRRDRGERSERPKMTSTQSSRGPSRQSPAEARPQPLRTESSRYAQPRSPRDSPPISRHNSGRGKLFGEVEDREPSAYSRRFETVSTSPRVDAESVNHGPYRRDSRDDHDYFPASKHRQELRNPASRRPSVY